MLNTMHFVPGKSMNIRRAPENGGDATYDTYEALEKAFVDLKLHPADLKAFVEGEINQLLDPIRKVKLL